MMQVKEILSSKYKMVVVSIFAFALIALAILLLSALLSYNVNDPAWSHSSNTTTTNFLGTIGAWYSDLSFSFIGYTSYFVPITLFFIALTTIFNKKIDKEIIAWQLVMLVVAIISASTLMSRHSLEPINDIAVTGGGILGLFLAEGLEQSIQGPIVMALSVLLFLSATTLIFNISWLKVIELTGAMITYPFFAHKRKAKEKPKTKSESKVDNKFDLLNRLAIDEHKPQESEEEKTTNSLTGSEPELLAPEEQKSRSDLFHFSSTSKEVEREPNIVGFKEEPSIDSLAFGRKKEVFGSTDSTLETESQDDLSSIFSAKKAKPYFDNDSANEYSNGSLNRADQSLNHDVIDHDLSFDQKQVSDELESVSFDSKSFDVIDDEPKIVEPTPELMQSFLEAAKQESVSTDNNSASVIESSFESFSDEVKDVTFDTSSDIKVKYQTLDEKAIQTSLDGEVKPENKPLTSSMTSLNAKASSVTIGQNVNGQQAESIDDEVKPYQLPSVNFLDTPPPQTNAYTEDMLADIAAKLETTLQQFKLDAVVMHVSPGPVITRFEIDLAPGVQAKKITALSTDLARALAVNTVRVEEVIPGSSYIGLEVPNLKRQVVYFKDIICSKVFQESSSPLTLTLGSDISGNPVVADLMKMPHLLVAGTTGSGKSVAINAMLLSMLYKSTPEDLRLILVDPKMLEMSMYEDIPHLLTPVITDMNDAENALTWAVAEMERRYQLMAALKVRKIEAFNDAIEKAKAKGESIKDPLWNPNESVGYTHHPDLEKLPFIVIVIDELADMMMVVGKQVEQLIARLTQKARAAGIHVILATQRPSVDVLTGLIKANVPTRIAFQVSSKIDSRTIIDNMGAENLLGHGDMLYVPPGVSHPKRLHGAFVSDSETDRITAFIRETGEPNYIDSITKKQDPATLGAFGAGSEEESDDPLYEEAVEIVLATGKASISSVQRQLRIGYNRAARMIEQMQAQGIVSEPINGVRKVLGRNN